MALRNQPNAGQVAGERVLYLLFGLLALIVLTLILFRTTGLFDERRTLSRVIILSELAVFVGFYLYLRLKIWRGRK